VTISFSAMHAETALHPRDGVEEAVCHLLRAIQTLRTYPASNQLAREALAALQPRLAAAAPFALELTASGFLLASEPIGGGEQDRAKVALALFRDGVRRLELRQGIEAAETERLVLALAKPIHADDLTEDYVTRLWEGDLPHVGVAAVDPYIDVDIQEAVLEGTSRPEPEAEDQAGEREHLPAPPEAAFVVTEADALRVAQEVEQADRLAPWGSFIEAVFATMRSDAEGKRGERLVQMIEAGMQRCLDSGRWKMATEILRRLRGSLPAPYPPLLRKAAERMATSERLRPLHDALERGECPPADAEAVLAGMAPLGLGAVCELLAATRSEHTRRFYADLLAKTGAQALPALLPAFQQTSDELRPLLIGVLGRIRDPLAGVTLVEALPAASGGTRREVVRALTLHQSDAGIAEQLLRVALDDTDGACRVIALRGLARGTGPAAQQRVLARIQARNFSGLPDEEKDLLFAALGRVGDDSAVPFLRGLLKPGWLFGGADRESWRRVAFALARLATPEALRTLEEHADSRHPDLARICTEALLQARRSSR